MAAVQKPQNRNDIRKKQKSVKFKYPHPLSRKQPQNSLCYEYRADDRMEGTKHRNPCDPCKCPPLNSHYFYSESIPFEDAKRKKAQRPSSASSVKSSRSGKKSLANSSKVASSDSKIARTRVAARPKSATQERMTKMETAQLRQDLSAIKEQLFLLTQKKYQMSTLDEGEVSKLKEKCQQQETEIEELKKQNEKLMHLVKEDKSAVTSMDELNKTKSYLDHYEEKLNMLYKEFLDTSKIMEENKDKVCKCISKKSQDYEDMVKTTKVLTKKIEDNNAKYTHLLGHFEKSQENEQKYLQKSNELSKIVEELEDQLNQTKTELEVTREASSTNEKKYQKKINENCQCYASKLQQKEKEIKELNKTIEELKKGQKSTNGGAKTDVEPKYEQLQQNNKQLTIKCRENCERSEEMEMMKENEKRLIGQVIHLQNYCKKMCSATNDHSAMISRLNSANKEKDSIIQCLRAEVASKNKQFDFLTRQEQVLKKRISELQEELVGIKIASYSVTKSSEGGTQVLHAGECSIHLTEELQDLINALYEEIDKTAEKDEQIAQQNKQIACLQCCLAAKEKELIGFRKELKILREQLNATLKENQALADHLKKMKNQI